MNKDPEFITFLNNCQWAINAQMSTAEMTRYAGCIKAHKNGHQTIPIVMACERTPSYLPATLFSLYHSGFSPPVIAWDSRKKGPGNAMAAIGTLMRNIARNTTTPLLFAVVQDDIWSSPDFFRATASLSVYASYVMAVYRMTPLQNIPHDIIEPIGDDCRASYVQTSDLKVSDIEKYDGGCGFIFSGGLFSNDHFVNSLQDSSDLPVPKQIGRAAANSYTGHYATTSNLVEHLGEVSSLPDRPDWFRMPVSSAVSTIAKSYIDLYTDDVQCAQIC